jgi:uncharacterized membrane protein
MPSSELSSRRTENTKATGRRTASALALVMVIIYASTFSVLTISKHDAFETSAYDLGNYDQAVWNTIHGRLFRLTNMAGLDSRLALHFEPILLPLSLSYLVYSDPRTLLVLQAVIVSLGALPVFWLAREKLNSDLAALVFPLAYLLFPALESANLFDFHTVTLAVPFLLYAFYFLQSRRYDLFTLFAILAMSCKEDIPLLVAMLGIYIFIFQKAKKAGVLTLVSSGCWFYIAVFLISPHFSPIGQNVHLERYAYLGQTPQEMASTVLTRPDLIWEQLVIEARVGYYLGQLLMPVAFISLLSPQTFLISLPSLAINLLSQHRPMHEVNRYHYAAPVVPFVIISSIYGTRLLARMASKWLNLPPKRAIHCLTGLVLVCSLIYHYLYGFTPLARYPRFYRVTDHDRLGEELVALVPPEAAVSAHWKLNPHLSEREEIYMFPRIEDADYVFLDVTRDSWPIHPVELYYRVSQMLQEGYGIRASKDGYILLQKGLANATELDSFYDFARVEHLQAEYPMVVDFGERLRFLGFDLISEEPELETISLRLYWQALQPLERDYYIYPFLFDGETGEIIEDTMERPMTTMIWYPTSQWRLNETISMETPPWDAKSHFKVGLKVIEGTHWYLDPKLPLQVVDSSLIIRPFDDGTSLELMEFRDYQPIDNRRLFEIPPIPHPLRADLGNKVALLGYDLKPTHLKSGETLHLTLYWQALTTMKTSYTVFTHLLDSEYKLWAQHDSQPVGGIHPTSAWAEGEIVKDEYSLSVPHNAPKGEYLIEVGMYEWQTNQRLPAFDKSGTPMPDDKIVLRRIQIERRK